MSETTTASALLADVGQMWGPPPDLTVSEWAGEHRVLVSESSAEPGRWSNLRAPYQVGIMDACCDDDVESVTVMSSAQIGKSEFLLNVIGYYIHQDPRPMLLIQPTLQMAEAFSKDRVAPMISACKPLSRAVESAGSRKGGNTLLHKQFPGGHLTLAGANSPASLASRPVPIILGDERNKWPASAGTEGDPWKLACMRAETFVGYRKLLDTSTPGYAGVCPIERSFLAGDQRRFWVPCPHCGEMQLLKFANLKWEKDAPAAAHFVCVGCGGQITEGHKAKMLAGGEWRAEKPFNGHASFQIWAAYSPWTTWESIAARFLADKKSPETLQVFTNAVLGETWEDRAMSVDNVTAENRCEPYDAEVPEGVAVLTAGVDTQDNRLEVSVYGWGLRDTPYAIDHVIIGGNTAGDAVWEKLDKLLFDREFDHASGARMKIAATCIDSGGHRTQQVYKFVEPRQVRRVYAIKGSSSDGMPLISAPNRKRMAESRTPVDVHMIGTDAGKSAVYHRLSLDSDDPARMRFPDREPFDEVFFAGLTAEKCVVEYRAGVPRRSWKKKTSSARNEPLDCAVYAMAAVHKLRPNYNVLLRKLTAHDGERDTPAPKKARKRRGGSFAGSWRK